MGPFGQQTVSTIKECLYTEFRKSVKIYDLYSADIYWVLTNQSKRVLGIRISAYFVIPGLNFTTMIIWLAQICFGNSLIIKLEQARRTVLWRGSETIWRGPRCDVTNQLAEPADRADSAPPHPALPATLFIIYKEQHMEPNRCLPTMNHAFLVNIYISNFAWRCFYFSPPPSETY